MQTRRLILWHVTCNTILRGHQAHCRLPTRRFPAQVLFCCCLSGMTLQASRIVGAGIAGQRLVWVVAGDASDAVVSLLPTLAVLEPVRRESNVEDSHAPVCQNVFPRTVASSAEVYGINSIEACRVKNKGLGPL